MGQFQNGRLYKRCRSSYLKNKANECKLNAIYINYIWSLLSSRKLRVKISILFISFLSFFLSFFRSSFADKLNLKTILCMRILHIPNNCSAITGRLPFLVWCSVRATTGKLWPRYCLFRRLACSLGYFWGVCTVELVRNLASCRLLW